MTTQTSYSENIGKAQAGQLNGCDFNAVTGIVETGAGIGFGKAVSQGVADKGIVLGGQSEDFLGITIRDVTLEITDADKYADTKNAGVLTRGQIWVLTGGAVAAGGVVKYNASTGVLSGSGEIVTGARWVTSAGSGELALVELAGTQNHPAT